MYDRIVSAALAETATKFRLAEALALDVPPRHPGPDAGQEKTIPEHLADARQAIIDAGGEPRSVETLDGYRKTALWVWVPEDPNFRWIAGASYTAHRRAMAAGLSYEQFAALPDKTGDAANEAAGRAPIRGISAIGSWTPEQKTQAAQQILADPEVAKKVFADPDAAGDAVRAAYVPLGEAMRDYDQRRYEQAVPPGSREEKVREAGERSIEVLEVIHRLQQVISSTGKLVSLGELSRDQRELIAPIAQRAKVAVDYLADLDADGATTSLSDDTIAEFLHDNS